MSSSESETECLITGFKSGNSNTFDYDDFKPIETSKNTVKTKILNADDLAKQKFLCLKEITGDGLCITRCSSEYFKLLLDQVLDQSFEKILIYVHHFQEN